MLRPLLPTRLRPRIRAGLSPARKPTSLSSDRPSSTHPSCVPRRSRQGACRSRLHRCSNHSRHRFREPSRPLRAISRERAARSPRTQRPRSKTPRLVHRPSVKPPRGVDSTAPRWHPLAGPRASVGSSRPTRLSKKRSPGTATPERQAPETACVLLL